MLSLIAFGPEAWEAVRPCLTAQEEDETLMRAVSIAKEWRDARAVPHLIELLEHPEFPMRLHVLEALSVFPGEDQTLYLLALLEDPEPGVQALAVGVLNAWGDADSRLRARLISRVRQLLGSKSAGQRLNALQIFVHLKGAGYPDILLECAGDPDPLIRQQAIRLMADYTQAQFKSALVHALSDEDARVRQAAISALGSSKPEGGLEPLLAALEDPDLWIRASAARVLGHYGYPPALMPLIHHVNNDIPPVKIACLEALGMLGDEKALGVILEQLRHPDMEVQKAALQALGVFSTPRARSVLEEHMGHADWRLRAAAIAALSAKPDPSILPLLAAMRHPELVDRIAALFISRKAVYAPLLETAWRKAGQRREEILSAILEEMGSHA